MQPTPITHTHGWIKESDISSRGVEWFSCSCGAVGRRFGARPAIYEIREGQSELIVQRMAKEARTKKPERPQITPVTWAETYEEDWYDDD